ncbi:MAG: hypothetical protein ACFE9W_11860 [Promethearchaeota archaeon]
MEVLEVVVVMQGTITLDDNLVWEHLRQFHMGYRLSYRHPRLNHYSHTTPSQLTSYLGVSIPIIASLIVLTAGVKKRRTQFSVNPISS